jgi:hypothetical protein
MKKIIVSLVLLTGLIVACSKSIDNSSSAIDCSGTAKSFTTDVNPIIQSYCAISGCHASGSTNGPGALTTYQQVFNNRSAIRTAVANGSMPQNSTLSTSQKTAIICWIDNGGTNN